MTTSTATSESNFFIEREEVFDLINILSSSSSASSASSPITTTTTSISPDVALAKLRSIFDKYLECPTLLDPSLEAMVTKLSAPARVIVHDLFLYQSDNSNNDNGDDIVDNKNHALNGIDDDPPMKVDNLCSNNSNNDNDENDNIHEKLDKLMHLLSAIYAISKVRGRKYVQRLLPHEVVDVEPVLVILRWFGWFEAGHHRQEVNGHVASLSSPRGVEGTNNGTTTHTNNKERTTNPAVPIAIERFRTKLLLTKENAEAQTWESLHSLLSWLGIISLVPFDLNTIDSSLADINDETTLVRSILATSASHLADYGTTRDTAAACLASLLSRPDLEMSELEGFVNWSARVVYMFRTGKSWEEKLDSTNNTAALIPLLLPLPVGTPSVFLVMGVLQTLSAIFKTGHRSNLLQQLRGIDLLWEQSILVAEGGTVGGSIIVRKLLVKLFARIGCAHLPPRIATWRYQRGKRSLVKNLRGGGEGGSSSLDDVSTTNAGCEYDDLFEIPDQVEDAMDQLLRSLTDPATIVRWSAAKGIGRLTERLPGICADDVLDAILLICSDPERDKAWHGACLALAELARRGLLLPTRLGEVVPIVVCAIRYDVRRGQHSVGTHVRDASCYVCWAFARAYSPSVLRPYVKELSAALVLTSLFDREVNCRRAASAAFQESVGRQGADNFKHGIAILTTADYYSLGNRVDAFLTLALDIAQFDEYQMPIIHHLADVKLLHWDIEIRSIASKSLASVSKLNPHYIAMHVLPKLIHQCLHDDLVVRHGSLLGVAEIVLAFGEANLVTQGEVLTSEMLSSVAELVPSIEQARLYRGRGGEIMRNAACRMVECISHAGVPLSVKQQVRLLDSVDACLVHPTEGIQTSAALALNALLENYFPVGCNGPSVRLQTRVMKKYISKVQTEDNPAATRGFSLALGHLPAKLLAPSCEVLDSVLTCLCNASKKDCLVGGEGDAETRRNSIVSLVSVCTTVGIYNGEVSAADGVAFPIYRLRKSETDRVFASLLTAMEDYNFDRRGDVGSWSRIAAMDGLEALVKLAIESSSTFPHSLGKDLKSPPEDIVVPSLKERLDCLTYKSPINDQLSSRERDDKAFIDEQLCCSILSALLKQLGEKLDTVRCKAGECLQRLLTDVSPRLPFVPNRCMLAEALNIRESTMNWSDPVQTFPLLLRAVNIDEFTEPILSGLVISVGGLTESVAKSSIASLFEWIRALRAANATSRIIRMGEVFLGLFKKHERDGRVLLPLLATLDKLLTHEYLNEVLAANSGSFRSNLVACLAKEAKSCSDIKRLLAMVGVSLALLQPNHESMSKMRSEIFPFIMAMLLNPYPRVRRYTAEQLYVKLVEDGEIMFDGDECVTDANQILLNTVWHDEQDPHGEMSAGMNRIADLLGIVLSEDQRNVKLKKGSGGSRSVTKDEFESYSSLVNNA